MSKIVCLTHFDAAYEAQAHVMLDSLFRHASQPVSVCALWLGGRTEMPDFTAPEPHSLEFVTLQQFMQYDQRYFMARENRSWKAFCWTLEPALIHQALRGAEQSGDDERILFYCDADSWFLSDPIPTILDCMERGDVALSPHSFPPGHEHKERTVGRYNFGCGVFRACDAARRIVSDWLDLVLAKCDEFAAGGQKHLDGWVDKLGDRLVELSRSVNCAPWSQYAVNAARAIIGQTDSTGTFRQFTMPEPLISWHGHEMRRGPGKNPVTINGEAWNLSNYTLHENTVENVYSPYLVELSKYLKGEPNGS